MFNYYDITRLLLGLDESEREEVIERVKEYIDSSIEEKEKYFSLLLHGVEEYRDCLRLLGLTKKIDSFFNSEISYEEAKEEILRLRSAKYNSGDTITENVYKTFEDKLYDFVILGIFTDNFDINKNATIKDVFNSKLEEKIDDIKSSIVPLPILIKEIERVESSTDKYKYIDKKLLDKLFYYENNKERFKDESSDAKNYDIKKYYESEYKKTKEIVELDKKHVREGLPAEILMHFKVSLYVMFLISTMAVPGLLGHKYYRKLEKSKSLNHYKTETIYEDDKIVTDTYDEYSTNHVDSLTFLKEYTKINDDICRVKTYDCTNMDVNSLFDIIPSENNLTNIEYVKNPDNMFTYGETFKTIYKMKYDSSEQTKLQKSLENKIGISAMVMVLFTLMNIFNIVSKGFIDDIFAEIFDLERGGEPSYSSLKRELKENKQKLRELAKKMNELDGKDLTIFNNKLSDVEKIIDEELNELKKQKKIQM